MITKEMFVEWKSHPVTREVFEEVQRVKEGLVENLSEGLTIGHDADSTYKLTLQAVNQIRGLNQLLNITYEDEEENEEETTFTDIIEN